MQLMYKFTWKKWVSSHAFIIEYEFYTISDKKEFPVFESIHNKNIPFCKDIRNVIETNIMIEAYSSHNIGKSHIYSERINMIDKSYSHKNTA